MTSIERTAYPRFKRLTTAHELHLFFAPTRDEVEWASSSTDCDEHLPALLLMLKSYQCMGCFPKLEDVPEVMVDFVRRAVELPEGTLPLYRAVKTAKNHRGLVRQRAGVVYDQAEARRIAEASIRKEAAAKNRPADLINTLFLALAPAAHGQLHAPQRGTGMSTNHDHHHTSGGQPRRSPQVGTAGALTDPAGISSTCAEEADLLF